MGRELSQDRFKKFVDISKKFYSWDIILREVGITEVSDKGDQYEIACPFHEDWSPSMRLNKELGIYHCFSCEAKGTYTKFLWEMGGKSIPYSLFCEQILQANPAMQSQLGFTSLYLSEKTLSAEFEKRRVFNPRTSLGVSAMPISTLSNKVQKIDNSWDGLVLSLTLLQQGLTTDNVYSTVSKRYQSRPKNIAESDRVSIEDLIK